MIYICRSAAVDLAAALSPPVCEKKSDGRYVQPLTLRVKRVWRIKTCASLIFTHILPGCPSEFFSDLQLI